MNKTGAQGESSFVAVIDVSLGGLAVCLMVVVVVIVVVVCRQQKSKL